MKPPRFLVVDGYTQAAREQLQAGGASVAADLYCDMLKKCSVAGTSCEIVFPSDPGVELPDADRLESFDGIAWTGCSLCLNDESPEVSRQVEFARAAFAAGVPSFGSCWAAQIAVAAIGGRLAANPKGREMGISRKIHLTLAGRGHPLYEGKPSVFDAFTSHDDEITHLPPGAVCLAGNAWTRVQAVCVTHLGTQFWGLQYHPEYDLRELARLTYCRIEKLMRQGFFRTEKAALEYIDQLEMLHADPERKDIAWLLGIDADVTNEDVRLTEVRNWVSKLVLPRMRLNRALQFHVS
ncbi:type 1 glutamine amidotransferase [Pirellulales bacterium]|nr:type 1 glutamine amidotransferase [Pirellulales bacterium]